MNRLTSRLPLLTLLVVLFLALVAPTQAQGVGRVQLTLPVGGVAHLECLPGSQIALSNDEQAGEMFCQPQSKATRSTPTQATVGRVELTLPVGGVAHLVCLPGSRLALTQVAPRAGQMDCQPLTK